MPRGKEEYKKMKEDFKVIGKRHVDFDLQEFYYGQYYGRGAGAAPTAPRRPRPRKQ
eukprot:gene15066-20981_t